MPNSDYIPQEISTSIVSPAAALALEVIFTVHHCRMVLTELGYLSCN